jgi:hypothetical protein
MGLHAATTGSPTITTTPTTLTSTGYAYHHVKLFFTGTIGASDRYEIIVYSYDPIATAFIRQYSDEVNFDTCGNTATLALQDRTWELVPTAGDGLQLVITKLAGADRVVNYQIIQAT